MPQLTTSRLTCSPLQEDDWPFFLALQQDPDVMRFVAQDRTVADIRDAFDSRLTPWTPGSAHWLCLVVRDNASQTPLGVTGYQHHEADCAEVGFLFAPRLRGKVTAMNPCRHSVIMPSTRGAPSSHRHRHGREYRLPASAGKSPLPAGG